MNDNGHKKHSDWLRKISGHYICIVSGCKWRRSSTVWISNIPKRNDQNDLSIFISQVKQPHDSLECIRRHIGDKHCLRDKHCLERNRVCEGYSSDKVIG